MAIPIHYDGFHIDGVYSTQPDELARFLEVASGEAYEVLTPKLGEDLTL
ncbi:hypothetical protein AB0G35_29550 [Streptomyces sp. NPDC021749]